MDGERLGLSTRTWVLIGVIALGVAVRTVHLTDPYIVDFHSFRQAETASFAHNYLIDSFAPWHPADSRYPCRFIGKRFGWVESELPLPAWLAVAPLKVLGVHYPPAWYLRSVWIGFFALGCWYLYRLVKRLDGKDEVAILSVFAYSAFPLSIFFSRAIMPDSPSLTLGLMVLDHLVRWFDEKRRSDEIAIVVLSVVLLWVKISNIYIAFPLVYLIIRRTGALRSFITPRYWIWLISIVLPVAAWYAYARHAPWSFGIWGHAKADKFSDLHSLQGIRLWRRFGHRLVEEIILWPGAVLALLGFVVGFKRESVRVALAWFFGYFVFLCVAIRGNAMHVYYQLPVVIPSAIAVAHAAHWLWNRRFVGPVIVAGALAYHVVLCRTALSPDTDEGDFGFFRDRRTYRQAIELLRRHVPEGQTIATTESAPEIFYNGRVRGYLMGGGSLEEIRRCTDPHGGALLIAGDRVEWMRRALRGAPDENDFELLERGRHYSIWRRNTAP